MDKTIKSPKVTVLMPVYNGEKYLKEAIESTLNQDFKDFEFLVINDGSTDASREIITSYSDPRIKVIENEKNLGLVNTLNKGLGLASGEYIVRMDCDDTSVRTRLSVQVKFMEKNKNIGVCGSYYYVLRGDKKAVADFPVDEKELRCFMLFNCPIAHPTAIVRSSVLKQHQLCYSSEYIHSEDYDLWSRVAEHSGLTNIPELLLNYRVHDKQITGNVNLASGRYKSVSGIRLRHLKKLDITISEEEIRIHNMLCDSEKFSDANQLNFAEQWLKKIIARNAEKKMFDENFLQKIVLERWIRLCFNFFKGIKAFRYFYNSDLYKMTDLPFARKKELFRNLYYSWKRLKIK